MSDLTKVVSIIDFKVSVKHHFNSSKMVLNAPLFSEVYNYYSEMKKEGIPVKQHHTLKTLLERLNTIKIKPTKNNSIAILKGLYKGGTSGEYCYKGAPYLFFDIDVKEKENPRLLDKKQNADVFEQLQKIAVLVWRSNSGNGIAGILYAPQIVGILNKDKVKHLCICNCITDYLAKTLNVDFDNAQNKFRQVRYLSLQTENRFINKNPYVFTYDLKEVVKVSNTGVKQYRFTDNRAVFGSIQDQFNNNTTIQTALLENSFKEVNTNRYKHPSTNSKTTGVVKDNIFFNHSSSFSNYKVFTPFWLYLTQNYAYDYKRFLDDLKQKGYNEKQPQQKAFIRAKKLLTLNTEDRDKQIFTACYDLQNATYKEKIKFIKDNAKNDVEKLRFFDYLKIKPLTIEYDKTLLIKDYVSEELSSVLDYADIHKKIVLTAETGTGKTTAFLKDFTKQRPSKRLLILAPLTAIVEQNKSDYKNIVALTGNSEPKEHTKAKTSLLVMATYEQGYKHLSTGNKFDYVIIDEVHNLITSHSFKRESLINLTSILHRFKVIGLTGTTNTLFQSIGYKLVNAKKVDLKAVDVSMIVDNRNPLKIALQHLESVKGKCIIRLNSRTNATDLKRELIRLKLYKKSEILILKSDAHIKKGADFLQLTEKSNFKENIKLVLTTSLIDEGLSIKQKGFTDVVFIENNYKPMPESVKQFFARFRNEDADRKNYFYFRETKDQTLNSWNPYFAFNQIKKELKEDAKTRDVTESKSNDIANNDYLFYANGQVNKYALAYDISTEFFKRATTLEYVNFLELNYNLNLIKSVNHQKTIIDLKDIKEKSNKVKQQIAFNWLNYKDEVLNTLYRLTDSRELKNSIDFIGINSSDEIYNLVQNNIKEFERLHKNTIILEGLEVENIDAKIIDFETMKPIPSKIINSKIRLLQNLSIIKNPQTATDKNNKKKFLSFIYEVSKYKSFNSSDLLKKWKKQRTKSVQFNTDNLRELVLYYHKYHYDKKVKKWLKI